MKRLLLILSLCLPLMLGNGCAIFGQPKPTAEAVVFYSFKDTYSLTRTAYLGFSEQVVLGKVSKLQEAKVDAAWNRFRAGFKASFKAASFNWSAATPSDVKLLSEDLLNAIRNL